VSKELMVLEELNSFGRLKLMHDRQSGFSEAIAAAKQADVVIMVVGEHGLQSGEGRSRSDLGLPGTGIVEQFSKPT
jgi:hypothetical protein